jgi:hypothetical protein
MGGAASSRIQSLQRRIAGDAVSVRPRILLHHAIIVVLKQVFLQDKQQADIEMLSDPMVMGVLKKQVQEALVHVRSLNQKIGSGKADPNSEEIKVCVKIPPVVAC